MLSNSTIEKIWRTGIDDTFGSDRDALLRKVADEVSSRLECAEATCEDLADQLAIPIGAVALAMMLVRYDEQ